MATPFSLMLRLRSLGNTALATTGLAAYAVKPLSAKLRLQSLRQDDGFSDVYGVALSAVVESNALVLTAGGPIAVTGGQYSVNGGAYTSVSGTVVAGDSVKVRVTASASNATMTTAMVTIAGVARPFNVLTIASSVAPLSISGTPAAAMVGGGATFAPVIAGGVAPYTLSLLSGSLPAGRSLSGLTVTGTYTAAGAYSYTLRVTDSAGSTADLAVSGTVSAAGGVPTIAFANPTATVTEGDTGTKAVSNTINVDRQGVTGALTINLAYGGTATSGTDYVAGPVSLTLADGVSSGSFDLTINGDTAVEADETIIINAALAGYAATASKTITVTNDDVAQAPLNYPRLGLIGPSTVQLNSYGATSGGQRVGNLNTGPVVWSLMKDRRAQMLITTQSTGQFFNGDNQGDGGAVFADYPPHIAALATRFTGLPTEKKLVYYEAGRNDAQNNNATLSDYQTNTSNQLASIRSQIAPSKILVAKLWPKPSIYSSSDSSKNQGWLIGGTLRQLVRDYNAWLDTYAASNPDIVLVDLYSRMVIDPSNPNSDTIAGTTLSDYTHFNSKGAQLAEAAFRTVLANLTTAQTYPTAPAGNVVPAFSGTGGTKTGTGVSGNVFDGWTLALSATGPTVVASQETIDGKAAQRITISNTQGLSTQGVNVTLSRSGLAIPASGKVGFRLRLRVSASGVPMIPFYQLGSSTAGGVTANARTTAIIGLSDATGTVVGGAGTNFVNAGKTDLTTALDLWVESPSYLEAASGGSSVPLELLHTIGAGASGDTLVIDIIDVQTFTWPI